MSLLDDARKMANEPPVTQDQTGDGHCAYCYGDYYIVDGAKVTRSDQIQHEPDCPWLSMPKIVAALEAVDGALRDLVFLSHPYFREDYLAVLSLADRVRSALLKSTDEPS